VIPNTVLGLVVLAAALGPGYVFVRVEERRRPRPTRSALLETAELVVIGGFASTLAFGFVAAVAAHSGWLDEKALAKNSTQYLLAHASRVTALVVVGLAMSYVATWLFARAFFRHRPANIEAISAWDRLLRARTGVMPYVTASLDDGLAIAGDVEAYTVGERPADERELIIANPELRAVGESTFRKARDHYVILRGDRIQTLAVIDYEVVVPKRDAPSGWKASFKAWAKRRLLALAARL